jgi:PleD family two-component response regulator
MEISIGVASLVNTDDMEKLLIKTDQALYKAKEGGRNCVVVFSEEKLQA